MAEQLRDGTGKGFLQKVNGNNRAYTDSIISTNQENAASLADSYHMISGTLTLTTANESAVFYFKNTSSTDFRIKDLIGGFGISTGGASGDVSLVKLIRNPTTGTIISDATNADIRCNRNFGSSKLLQDSSNIYKGAEGKTITDGVDHFIVYAPNANFFSQLLDEVIPKGASMGFNVTPPASNSSMSCYIGVIGHYEDVNK